MGIVYDFNFFLYLQFLMIFGTAVFNRPIVAAAVKDQYDKVLNLLSLELSRVKVSGLDLYVI